MYPEDFYDPSTDFAAIVKLLNFTRAHKISDIRSKARRMRDIFKQVAADGGLLGEHFAVNMALIISQLN